MKGWVTKRLEEVADSDCSLSYGIVQPGEEFLDGLPVVRPTDLTKKVIELSELKRIDPKLAAGYQRTKLQGGELLLCVRGSTGTISVASSELSGANVTRGIVPIRFKKPLVDSNFGYYLMIADQVQRQIREKTYGAALMQINIRDLRNIAIPLPPLAEQQRIVGVLDEAFEGLATARANAEKNLQNARALFESHLQSVFTQRGPGWVEATLDKATAGVFTGPFGSLLHKHDYVENGIPLVNPAHITDTGIEPDMRKTVSEDTAKRLANYIMREGDVVIGRRGEMGRCALVTEVEEGWLCGTGSFFIKPSDRCDMGFLVRYLRSEGCRKKLEALAGGAVMPNLSNTALGGLSIFLPPPREQKKIVNEIDALSAETQRLTSLYERKLAALESLKKALLHQAFAGEL